MDELLKQRIMYAVAGFNFAVIASEMTQYLLWGCDTWGKFFFQFAISAGIGAVVAIGTYVAVQMSQK